MPTPTRTPGTASSRPGLKVTAVIAALMTAAAVMALAFFTPAALGGSRSQPAVARPNPTTAPATASPTSSKVAQQKVAPRPITVVGIGDSVTAGQNCDCRAFVELYAASLAATRGFHTTSINLGVSGWTSAQLLASLTQPGPFRNQVAKADILLVTIGANDLVPLESRQSQGCATTCYAPLVESVGHNVELIVAAARAAHPGHPPTILVTNYWNVFQDGDVGTAENGTSFQSWSDTLTRASGAQICDGAQPASVAKPCPQRGPG